MNTNETPPKDYLLECFHYDEITGDLSWKVRPQHHYKSISSWRFATANFAGTTIGRKTSNRNRYITVRIDNILYYAHRVIYKILHNSDPVIIDHIDGNKRNNSKCNLRGCSQSVNSKNSKRSITNTSGQTGVSWSKKFLRWNVNIVVNGKQRYLGRFTDFELAVKARKEAEIKYGFSPTHGRPTTINNGEIKK
jgi:hypothetical protein